VGSDQSEIEAFIEKLHQNFKITTGTLSYFLGMLIQQRQDGIFESQRVYTENILERFKMHEANPVATPCDCSGGGIRDAVESHVPYREAVQFLVYLMTATRPDIAFAVSRAAPAMDQPTEADWLDVKCILKYLRGTSN
jgi:hypothetical protein